MQQQKPVIQNGKAPQAASTVEIPLQKIQEAVASIRFGSVQIIIQDGRVVQIDKTEKIRLV
ncbi:hypothetical protein CCAX7_004810 [Capsulimonas corticalis]|uniref:Uncharacterized protein n=1 Tax=Capsulimonas corticalis TaxID=2219043 RepID=A0A402D2U8_9BACT|nr:YezD family protein [Capsulimonas corticalis]BDI28430.1 hypothetical protein CCAX7_004810 [Capsulimonas corticalis]